MGKLFSKHPSKTVKSDLTKPQISVQNVQDEELYEIHDPDKYHLEAVEILKREFKEDPETFILNMLLMSFMFFDDYQEEIRILANTSPEKGKRLNAQLIQDHQKQILMPDAVLESVNRRVKFRVTNGPKKGLMEPLVSQRMFILHDTIEIEDKKDTPDYSRIDKPSYRAEIEESRANKGFVKVNLLGTSGRHSNESENRSPSADSASSSSSKNGQRKSDDCLLNRNGQEDSPAAVWVLENDSGFSTAVNSDSSYEYYRITAAKTPRKLYITEKDVYTSISQLPKKCITPVRVRNEEDLDSDDDDENENYKNRKRKRHPPEADLFRIHYFLNSTEFMSHFKNNIFPNCLGEVLGFSDECIHQATSIPGAIYCDTMDDMYDITKWEIIPTIPMPWPDEIAFEWTLRRRRTVWDKREKKPIAYKWPTPKMVEEANKLNCVVVPRGFMPKKGENSDMDIEWEVGFPKAERYLEFRMSHAQMKIFLYTITLHKKFIEPLTSKHGLLVEHLRTLMFWECEANYKAWPEDKLGTKLKMVLKTLYDYIGKGQLPHYFIRTKNVLENVPRKYLIPAQDVLHRILETPLPYLFSALKHLKYMPGKFYSEPDLEKLYDILAPEIVLHRDAQLNIMAFEKAKNEEEVKRRNEKNMDKRDKEQKWNRRYLEQQKNANKRKLLKSEAAKPENLKMQRSESTDSITFNFSVKKRLVDDVYRQILLLTFFIDHFLEIAKKSLKISTTNQTMFYLKQAWYLTMLLEEINYESALKFQREIKEEEENCLRKQVTEPKIPSTPKRNSTLFASEILQVKGKDINIANLSKSYNANALVSDPKPSTSGVKKKTIMKQNQVDAKNNQRENRTRVEIEISNSTITNDENEGIRVRQFTPAREIRKSVSFRNQDRNIDLNVTDDEAESTSL